MTGPYRMTGPAPGEDVEPEPGNPTLPDAQPEPNDDPAEQDDDPEADDEEA